MTADRNYTTPIEFLEATGAFDPLEARNALAGFIEKLPQDDILPVVKKYHKLARKFGRAMKRNGKEAKAIWLRLEVTCSYELEEIMYACFIAGLSYGLSPVVNISVYDLTVAAASRVESAHWPCWRTAEQDIALLSPDIQAQYALFDRATATYKGHLQDWAFTQGMRTGQRFSDHIARLSPR